MLTIFHLSSIRYLILAGLAIPILRYTSLHFTAINNNAIRFLSGGLFFICLANIYYKKEFLATLKNYRLLLIILLNATMMALNMVFFVKGLALSSSFMGSVFATLGLPIAIIIATIVYTDERARVLSFSFFIGLSISVVGTIIFLLASIDDPNINFQASTLYFSINIIIQALQGLIIKYLSKKTPLIVLGSFTASFTGILLLSIAIISGSIVEFFTKTPLQIAILSMAGIYGMFVGMILGFGVIQKQGIAVFNILQLLIPISTAFFGYILLKENISYTQWGGALIIIIGAYISLFNNKG